MNRQKLLFNTLTALPVALAVAFGLSLWQSGGRLNGVNDPDGFNLSSPLAIQTVQAQSTCDPTANPSLGVTGNDGNGRLYYNNCVNKFRMYVAGQWQELGGGVWEAYPASTALPITTNDIHNTNTGLVYVNSEAVFGVTNWDNGSGVPTIRSLATANSNLIYGVVDGGASDPDSNLLQLAVYQGGTNYDKQLQVRVDGQVLLGPTGKLVAPEICLPNATDADACITQWSDITTGGSGSPPADSDKWWAQADVSSQGEITNRNYLDTSNPSGGGNVTITRTLKTYGDLEIRQNRADVATWMTMAVPASSNGPLITNTWYDYINSAYSQSSLDDGDTATVTSSGTVYLAVTDSGTIIVVRGEGRSSAVPLLNSASNGLVYTSIIQSGTIAAKPIYAVCSLGDPDYASYDYKYKIIAVGADGEFWVYEDTSNGGNTWAWVKKSIVGLPAGHVNTTPDLYGVSCKVTSGSSNGNYGGFEAYAVGEYGAILRYTGGSSVSWVRPTCGPGDTAPVCGGVNYPTLRAISQTYVTHEYAARYYAVGDANNTGTNNIFYWPQGSDEASEVLSRPISTSNDFYAVRTYIGACAGCANGRLVYVGGESGVLYRASQDAATPNFTQLASGNSTMFDITGILSSGYTVFASLKSRNPSLTNERFMVKYMPREGITTFPLVDQWLDAPFTNNSSYDGLDITAISGFARSRPSNGEDIVRILGAGGTNSVLIDSNKLQFDFEDYQPTSWTPNPRYSDATWSQRNFGSGATLYTSWHPNNISGFDGINSYVGGQSGNIHRGKWATNQVFGYTADETKVIDVKGIWGHPTGSTTPYNVFAVATRRYSDTQAKGYILKRTVISGTLEEYFEKVKDFTAAPGQLYGFNGVWGNNGGTLVVAVGQSGRLFYCTSNCTSNGSVWSQVNLAGELRGISGKSDGSVFFIVNDAGAIYRCTGPTACGSAYSTGVSLRAVWVRERDNKAWAVGDNGKIFYNPNVNSNTWQDISGTTGVAGLSSVNFFSVAGAANRVFFGGDGGRILYSIDGSSNWRLDDVGPSSDIFYSMAGAEWGTGNAGVVWAVGSTNLGREYRIGAQALSGDLSAEYNKWGVASGDILSGLSTTKWCDNGQYIVGIQFNASGGIVSFKCRAL